MKIIMSLIFMLIVKLEIDKKDILLFLLTDIFVSIIKIKNE